MTTGNTRVLCQNCGSTYTRGSTYQPGDEFCGNCGQRLTDVNGNTVPIPGSTPLPPPPPTQPSFRPLTPTYPVTAKQPFWTRGKIIVLTATILLLLLFLGAGLFSLAYQLGRNSTPISPIATTASGTTATTASGTTATTVPTASGTTPTTTPTPKVIPINQTMTIISPQAAASFFSLIVKTATIDPARMQMTLLIGLQNNGTSAVSEHLNYLRFQDQTTGDTKDGAGEGFTGIDFAPGQTILFRPTFPFTPVAGRTYQLSAQLGDFYDFSPITIKF